MTSLDNYLSSVPWGGKNAKKETENKEIMEANTRQYVLCSWDGRSYSRDFPRRPGKASAVSFVRSTHGTANNAESGQQKKKGKISISQLYRDYKVTSLWIIVCGLIAIILATI